MEREALRRANRSAKAFALLFVALASFAHAQRGQTPSTSNDNIILVTLDGARTQEIFGGLDLEIFKSTLKGDAKPEDQPT